MTCPLCRSGAEPSLPWVDVLSMVEKIGAHLVTATRGIVADLGFDPADPAVAAVIRNRLDPPRRAQAEMTKQALDVAIERRRGALD